MMAQRAEDRTSGVNLAILYSLYLITSHVPMLHAIYSPSLEIAAPVHLTSRDGGNAVDCWEQSLPEHRRSFASLQPRHTVHPEHNRYQQSWLPHNLANPKCIRGQVHIIGLAQAQKNEPDPFADPLFDRTAPLSKSQSCDTNSVPFFGPVSQYGTPRPKHIHSS